MGKNWQDSNCTRPRRILALDPIAKAQPARLVSRLLSASPKRRILARLHHDFTEKAHLCTRPRRISALDLIAKAQTARLVSRLPRKGEFWLDFTTTSSKRRIFALDQGELRHSTSSRRLRPHVWSLGFPEKAKFGSTSPRLHRKGASLHSTKVNFGTRPHREGSDRTFGLSASPKRRILARLHRKGASLHSTKANFGTRPHREGSDRTFGLSASRKRRILARLHHDFTKKAHLCTRPRRILALDLIAKAQTARLVSRLPRKGEFWLDFTTTSPKRHIFALDQGEFRHSTSSRRLRPHVWSLGFPEKANFGSTSPRLHQKGKSLHLTKVNFGTQPHREDSDRTFGLSASPKR